MLLVQGPPGTERATRWAGPSWCGCAARLAGATSFRVAVSSKTHNAINIVLASVAEKLALLGAHAPASALARATRELPVYKLDGDNAPPARASGTWTPTGRRDGSISCSRLGGWWWGTPGGLYNAQRYRGQGGNDVPWNDRPFDLVVIDEASQVNAPEAVLACAFLRPGGALVAVGDHRQMPPIVAGTWNEEARRTVVDSEVYRSVFDLLRERRFPPWGSTRASGCTASWPRSWILFVPPPPPTGTTSSAVLTSCSTTPQRGPSRPRRKLIWSDDSSACAGGGRGPQSRP